MLIPGCEEFSQSLLLYQSKGWDRDHQSLLLKEIEPKKFNGIARTNFHPQQSVCDATVVNRDREKEKQHIECPIWVKIMHLPKEIWSWNCLSFMASLIGKPYRMDDITAKKQRMGYVSVSS